ncbi:lysine transporter LysE [Rhizobium oryziradicis]|uniref:Lysine transporter LysE n=2 Tax=Rhizobium oryziradicis TaxID=1867956 RepID=A0A1Q8ZP18_9HYPH|nr:LysE family transporter [Rhizobium oryziradicis]OLP43487.1 lysine transporter LysE [Rhizobium oryziradicis]
MLFILLAKGFLLGIAVAAPVGPIGTLCINRTIERGFWQGVATGIGGALGDTLFAIAAAAGFAAMQDFLREISLPLKLIGGLLILIIGIQTLKPRPARVAKTGDVASDIARVTLSTFLLTITNPATLFGFVALFAGAGLADTGGTSPFFLVAGVFIGSLSWCFMLCGAVRWMHHKLPDHFTAWISKGSAILLIGFGLVSLALAAKQMWA